MVVRARLSLRATRAWGPGSKAPIAEWISEGLWIAWGPDEQSFDDSKAPCGGRPRSVWNPPPMSVATLAWRAFLAANLKRR